MSDRRPIPLTIAAFAVAMCWAVSGAQAQTVAALASPPAPQGTATTPSHPAPTDPVKLAAFKVLDTHCSRCHEADRLVGRSKPAKGFGNILDLEAVGKNPKYVTPGDADRSLLYHTIIRQEMPSDVFQDGDLDHPAPTDKDLQALRAWIVKLKSEPKDVQVASLPHADERLPAATGVTEPAKVEPATPEPKPAAPAAVAPLAPQPTASEQRQLVTDAQDNLRRVGCYAGTISGVADAPTTGAIARYNSTMGRGDQASPITPELIEELKSQDGRVCIDRPIVASLPAPDDTPRIAPAAPDAQPEVSPPAKSRPPSVAHPVAIAPPSATKAKEEPAKAAPRRSQTAALEEQPKPARRAAPSPAKARVEPPPAERKAAPPRKVARDVPLRQPPARQAQRQAPAYRQAQRAPSAPGGGGGGARGGDGGGGSPGVSGLNGI